MNKVLYNIDQRNDTTDAQKQTARDNISAASAVSLSEETARAIAAEVASATYDSENHLILFKNSANTQLFSLDATAFVMGGMIDSVVVEDGYLKITFITESGTETVSVDIGDIFDADNYYTKSDTDLLLDAKQATVSTDTDGSAFSENTTIATGFSNNKVHLNTASRLWAWIKSQISSVLGLSEDNGTKTYSGTADTADKVNYDTINSGNAYVPVFDCNGKRLKVVAGSRGLIMQKASDGAYALLNCKAALAADADHSANADNATSGASGTNIETYFTANTQNINDINAALNNKQPLCNMYIDGTNASSGTAYTETVNARAKGYAPMLNVGGIYLPLTYVSLDPNDSSVMWYHFEDSVSSTNKAYHRIVKPSSITNSDTTLSYTAGNGIDITGTTISAKVKSGGDIAVDPADGIYLLKREVTFTESARTITSKTQNFTTLFNWAQPQNGYRIDAQLRHSTYGTLYTSDVKVSGSSSTGAVEFTFRYCQAGTNDVNFEHIIRVIVQSITTYYREEVLAPLSPYFTYVYTNGTWVTTTYINKKTCTLSDFVAACNNASPGLGGEGMRPFGIVKWNDGSVTHLNISYVYTHNNKVNIEFSAAVRDFLATPSATNMLIHAVVNTDGITLDGTNI